MGFQSLKVKQFIKERFLIYIYRHFKTVSSNISKNADNIVFVFLVLSYQDIPDIYLAQQKPNHVYRVGVVVVVSPTITVGLSLRLSLVWLVL